MFTLAFLPTRPFGLLPIGSEAMRLNICRILTTFENNNNNIDNSSSYFRIQFRSVVKAKNSNMKIYPQIQSRHIHISQRTVVAYM